MMTVLIESYLSLTPVALSLTVEELRPCFVILHLASVVVYLVSRSLSSRIQFFLLNED